ncbi:MAG: 50S ribosome-binding GTPase [Treponemataceae bacterium]
MITEYGLLLAAHTAVLDEKIHHEAYFAIAEEIRENNLSNEVKDEVLKILGDDDEKKDVKSILSEIKKHTSENKAEIIQFCIQIALVDDDFSKKENNFLEEVCREIGYSIREYRRDIDQIRKIDKPTENLITKQKGGKTIYKILSHIGTEAFKEKFKRLYRDCLLSGEGYSNAIETMQKIAREDLGFAKESLTYVSNEMDSFLKSFSLSASKIIGSSDKFKKKNDSIDFSKTFDELKNKISNFVEDTNTQITDALPKKETAANYYTISFMGRTKAGKSTLHSIILGGIDEEFIGAGKERTTRYNRVYEWKGIRIIDTPGIGAPDGKSDEEIAQSITDESDLVCYVVTSDSVQETEFAFLKELKNQNKPIVILLNKKQNLLQPIHKKKFLENSKKWKTEKGNDSLDGALIRIKEYADKYYNNAYFNIYPVHLLAARLSLTETDAKTKKKLYEGSYIQDFLDELRVQILENGTIKRSQTMLNDTIYLLDKFISENTKELNSLTEMKISLDKNSKEACEKIEDSRHTRKESLEKGLNQLYDGFVENDIRRFANDYYDLKEKEIESAWKNYIKENDFEGRLKHRFEKEVEQFKTDVENILQEFTENLSFQFSQFNLSHEAGDLFDSRFFTKMFGGFIGLVGSVVLTIFGLSNPVGWALTLGGILVGLLSGLFKSKEEKIKEAQDKLYESLKTSINENRTKTLDDLIQKFENYSQKVFTSIENGFAEMIQGLSSIISQLKPLLNKTEKEYKKLNSLYAIRIINFDRKNSLTLSEENASRIRTERDFGKKFIIKTDLVKKINTEKLKLVLQEDILLEEM